MASSEQRTIVVTGATGRQGGSVARHLLRNGWRIQALTRNPRSAAARALADLGATIVQGNMEDPESLRTAFAGAYGVYSVQTPYVAGHDSEIRQGKNVAEAARAAGVQHLVYGSAGIGKAGTDVPSWESKLQIEAHIQALGLPYTILRPMAFMELMTDKAFFPAITTWHVMPTVMGSSRQVLWLCTDDLGAIAAKAFAEPDRFIGQALCLASDQQSIEECRSIYRSIMAKDPPRFPLPIWAYERLPHIGKDIVKMYRWLRVSPTDVDLKVTRSIHPGALSVAAWLRTQKR